MNGWESNLSHRNEKKRIKRIQKLEKKLFWINLQSHYPHIMMPEKAISLSKRLRIDKLDTCFQSPSWIEYQKEGWSFVKVVKPEDNFSLEDHHSVKPLDNGYGDFVVFKKLDIQKDQD